MLLSKKILMVLPNPFAAPLDADGFPCAFFMHDPEHRVAAKYIGATVERKVSDPRPDKFGGRQARYAVAVKYTFEPAKAVDTQYHRRALVSGDLLCADAATAKIVGLKKFVQPTEALKALAADAAETWVREHDGDAPPIAEWPERGVPKDVLPSASEALPEASANTSADGGDA